MSWLFEHPTAADLAAVRDLLKTSDLPSDDVGEHLEHFLIVRAGGKIIGVVGMEIHGKAGLLRSLAVHPDQRGTGLGKALTSKILTAAHSAGLQEVGLLTTTADKFFVKFGFIPVRREHTPEWIKLSKEYKVYCPSTAIIMVKPVE